MLYLDAEITTLRVPERFQRVFELEVKVFLSLEVTEMSQKDFDRRLVELEIICFYFLPMSRSASTLTFIPNVKLVLNGPSGPKTSQKTNP